jgi:hypothetical protein
LETLPAAETVDGVFLLELGGRGGLNPLQEEGLQIPAAELLGNLFDVSTSWCIMAANGSSPSIQWSMCSTMAPLAPASASISGEKGGRRSDWMMGMSVKVSASTRVS